VLLPQRKSLSKLKEMKSLLIFFFAVAMVKKFIHRAQLLSLNLWFIKMQFTLPVAAVAGIHLPALTGEDVSMSSGGAELQSLDEVSMNSAVIPWRYRLQEPPVLIWQSPRHQLTAVLQ